MIILWCGVLNTTPWFDVLGGLTGLSTEWCSWWWIIAVKEHNAESAKEKGVICISEVIDISPGNLDASLCFFQPSISHDVLCIEVKQAGWQYTAMTYSFSYLEPVCCSMSSSNIVSWPAYRFFKRQVRWSGIPIYVTSHNFSYYLKVLYVTIVTNLLCQLHCNNI